MDMSMNLADALRNGMTVEELSSHFSEALAEAQAEVAAEQDARNDELAEARFKLADAIVDYVEALDILPEEAFDELNVDEIAETIEKAEKEYLQMVEAMNPLMSILKEALDEEVNKSQIKKPTNADKTITNFLRSLK